jgi:hypothetical protein
MSIIKNGNLLANLAKISHLSAIQKKQGYIVGGFIRDWLSKRETNDIDIAVSGDAITIAREVAGEIGGKFVLLDDVNNIARVVVIEDEQPGGTSQNQGLLTRVRLHNCQNCATAIRCITHSAILLNSAFQIAIWARWQCFRR